MPFLSTGITSVVVRYFHVSRTIASPTETDPELVVDSDAVLTLAVAPQQFQPISRRRAQEVQRMRSIQHRKLARCDSSNPRVPLGPAGFEEALRLYAPEALVHLMIL
jgi:hypothetical protein